MDAFVFVFILGTILRVKKIFRTLCRSSLRYEIHVRSSLKLLTQIQLIPIYHVSLKEVTNTSVKPNAAATRSLGRPVAYTDANSAQRLVNPLLPSMASSISRLVLDLVRSGTATRRRDPTGQPAAPLPPWYVPVHTNLISG